MEPDDGVREEVEEGRMMLDDRTRENRGQTQN